MIKLPKSNLLILCVLGHLFYFVASEPYEKGSNICNESVTVRKEKLVTVPVKYEIQTPSMCGIIPCTKVRHQIRYDTKIQTYYDELVKRVCCPGYAETPDRRCDPICLKPCVHGKCSQPGICSCHVKPTDISPGFVGPSCTRFVCLSDNKWGKNCDKECDCPATAYCSASSGKCLCRTGWTGPNCSEECTPNSNCDDVDLPLVIEPEVNVIDDNLISTSSQRLVSSHARSMLGENGETISDDSNAKSVANLIATHMTINLLCLLITGVLIFTLFWYKKRLTQLRNNLYYGAYSSTSSGSSDGGDPGNHIYSDLSMNSTIQNRPRMPTPFESDFLDKNLNFASATRNILNTKSSPDMSKRLECRNKLLLDPKVESHLISSQKNSEHNVYSDMEPQSGKPENRILTSLTIDTDRSKLDLIAEENEYQVPKSPQQRALENASRVESSFVNNHYDSLRNESTSEQSYYEEIRPKSPKKI